MVQLPTRPGALFFRSPERAIASPPLDYRSRIKSGTALQTRNVLVSRALLREPAQLSRQPKR